MLLVQCTGTGLGSVTHCYQVAVCESLLQEEHVTRGLHCIWGCSIAWLTPWPGSPAGPILDPYEGLRSMSGPMSILGGLAGFIKAVIGLGARPTAGFIESGSKVLQVGGWVMTWHTYRKLLIAGHNMLAAA